jgi:NADP-dependent 3-hydroxy acid dehydrogenase YdfG
MIDLNLKGLLNITHAAVPHLLAAAEDSQRNCADLVNVSSVAGRVARSGSGVYNLTKHGVGAFSESFRQEFGNRRVRSTIIEPGAVDTELTDHLREGVREQVRERFAGMQTLHAADIADAIAYAVTRPWHVCLNEILIRPTEQEG